MAREELERRGVSQDNDGLRHAPVKESLGYKFCTVSQKSVHSEVLHGRCASTLDGFKACKLIHICGKFMCKNGPLYYGIHVRDREESPLKMGRMSATRCWV